MKKSNADVELQEDNLEDNESGKESSGDFSNKVDELNKQINELNNTVLKKDAEISELKDIMMRRQADFENYKKRISLNQDTDRKMLIKDLASEFLSVNDNLIRASDAASHVKEGESLENAHKSYVDGVIMISKQIENILSKFGIEMIDPDNEEFNPEVHEAVEINESEDVQGDTVTKTYQKGYKLDKYILRSAKVRVTKAKVIKKDDADGMND